MIKRRSILSILFTAMAALLPSPSLSASRIFQDPAQPAAEQPAQVDPIRQLNLTQEQRQRVRAIYEDNRDERVRINRRLKDAQLALEETLDQDSPSEAAVEERIRDVAAAQAAQIRMRALTELRLRSVLTPDQLRIWRELRIRQQALRRRLNNENGGRPPAQRDPNGQNGMTPLFPNPRRPPRPR